MGRRQPSRTEQIIAQTKRFVAGNYDTMPVVLERGNGCYFIDAEGNNYLDLLSGYGMVNFGHRHPQILRAAKAQLDLLAVCPRVFYTTNLGEFCQRLVELCDLGESLVLPMNTGTEAVEKAVKIARKCGWEIGLNEPNIIGCGETCFHGRTLGSLSISRFEQYRKGFGPFLPGFESIPFGDAKALENAIDKNKNTVAFIVEPIQAEGGIIVPPAGYLKEVETICREKGVLLIADEVYTGFGRTGKNFAYMHEGVNPDMVLVAKALGGGILPISAVVGRKNVMEVLGPGDDGSTFGGNPLACAVAIEAMTVLKQEKLADNAAKVGNYFLEGLKQIKSKRIKEVRGKGLLIGIELKESAGEAQKFCEALRKQKILCAKAREHVVRFSPPLTISYNEIDWALERIKKVFRKLWI